jgi:WD40 repeat protein
VLVSVGDDARIQVWDGETGSHISTIEGHEAPIWTLSFFPDGRRIVTGAGQWNINLIKQGWPADRTAVIWDLQTGKRAGFGNLHRAISGASA